MADNSISVATGDTEVSGNLTHFVAAQGDLLVANGTVAVVEGALSTSRLLLRHPWRGAPLADFTGWEILPTGPYWSSTVTTNRRITELIQMLEGGMPLKPDRAGPIAERSQYDNQAEGFLFLQTDIHPFLLYVKTGPGPDDWSAGQRLQADVGAETVEAIASATAAHASEVAAAGSASAALTSQTAAKTSETNAKASEVNAASSQTAAASSATAAGSSQAAAASSASAALASQNAAKTSETNAAASKTAAATSESNAASSAAASLASQTAAATSETNAAASASAAKTSETNAKTSETNAKTSETNANTSRTNAATSATLAGTNAALARFLDAEPKATQTFDTDAGGWLISQGTATFANGIMTVTTSGTDSQIHRSDLSFSGARYTRVIVRMRRITGTGSPNSSDNLVMYWARSAPTARGFSTLAGTILGGRPASITNGTWYEFVYDMAAVAGTDWTSSTISGLRLDLINVSGEVWEVDYILVVGPDAAAPVKSAVAAAASQTAAAGSAAAAATSATNAATSASTATTQASNAATSASAAQTARTGAETAQTGAQTARTGAETARTGAETARTDAQMARTEAQSARDTARLWATGAVNVPVSGAEYSAYHWAQQAKTWASGSATNIAVTPTGGIAATNVQAALAELDSEKLAKTDPINPLTTGAATNAFTHPLGLSIYSEVWNGNGHPAYGAYLNMKINENRAWTLCGAADGELWFRTKHTTTFDAATGANAGDTDLTDDYSRWIRVWSDWNFNPATKADLSGADFTGEVKMFNPTLKAQAGLEGGEIIFQRGPTSALTTNVHIDTVGSALRFLAENKVWSLDLTQQSGVLWHSGNFNPAEKAPTSNPAFSGTISLSGGHPQFNVLTAGYNFDVNGRGWHMAYRPNDYAVAGEANEISWHFWNGSQYNKVMALRPDGPAEFYGTVVAKNGIARLQGYGGNAGAGVLYFGTGLDKYLYWDGANFSLTGNLNLQGKLGVPAGQALDLGRLSKIYDNASDRMVLQSNYFGWLNSTGTAWAATLTEAGHFSPHAIGTGKIDSSSQIEITSTDNGLWLHYPGLRRARFKHEYNDRLYYVDQGGGAFFSIGPSGDYIKGNGHSMISTDNFLSYFSMRHVSHTYTGGIAAGTHWQAQDVVLYGGVVTATSVHGHYYKYPQFLWNGTWYGY